MAHQITTDPVDPRAWPHALSASVAVRATQWPSLRPHKDPGLYGSRAPESTESERPEPGVPQNERQGSRGRGRAPHCEVHGARQAGGAGLGSATLPAPPQRTLGSVRQQRPPTPPRGCETRLLDENAWQGGGRVRSH